MTGNKSLTKDTYGKTLIELGRRDSRIVAVEADLMKASGSETFMNEFPGRHINIGIAEQNLVGIAAGLASMGKIPFASTFSCFISQRACDQAINSVCYNKFNVKLCGTYAGLSSEKNGGTHISVEDISVFRSMPNMTVYAPADCRELELVMEAAASYDGPVYIRIARGPLYDIFSREYKFVPGKAVILQPGNDITLITTDITTWEGILACRELEAAGIKVRHIHMPTIKPIDREEILRAARETGIIVTAENHSILGGLGSAVTETVCEEYPVMVKRLGIDDKFGVTAKLDWLLNEFGISSKHIVDCVKEVLKRKGR